MTGGKNKTMLIAFKVKNQRLVRLKLTPKQEKLQNAVWIDLIEPVTIERERVQQELRQNITTKPELEDIESSARFFEDAHGLHIHSFFFYEDIEDRPGNATVAFIVKGSRLYTFRERELPAFRLYRIRFVNKVTKNINAFKILLDLFETKIEQMADVIEGIYNALEKLSNSIMLTQSKHDQAFSRLAELEDISWKVRLCLMDSQRALNFLVRKSNLPSYQLAQAKEMCRDIESLLPHNESLFQKVNFLMQAAMGFININQNRVIKIFSVVSVVFLPPTLVASSYGMNFQFMPELSWRYGYPSAILLMIFAGLVPYLYFKWKKWL